MGDSYAIGTAARLTGLSIDLLRAWERRYRVVQPKRGGKRRGYDQQEIDRLILLRRAVDQGYSIGKMAKLSDGELRELLGDAPAPAGGEASLIKPLLEALDHFDYAGLNERMARMAAMLAPGELVRQVVLPVLHEVGNRWHDGQLTTAQEHMITGLTHQILGALMRQYRPSSRAAKLIFTTPEGELHEMGILAAAILAAAAGFSPIYLGPNLPAKEIAYASKRSGAKVVVLQVTEASGAQVKAVRDALPDAVELWIGGAHPHQAETIELTDFDALEMQYKRLTAA